MCLALLTAASASAQPADRDFVDHFRDQLLYIHPIANYSFNPAWQREWEGALYGGNSIRSSFGSVTLTELLCDSRVVINERLIGGLWFRLDDRWYASHHIDVEQKSTFVGLEQYVWKRLSLFCYGDLAFNKEDADILFGVSVSDSTRRRYARVGFLDEDQFYDEKNDFHGSTDRRPLGITWAANLVRGRVALFSEGRYSSGFRRRYPDETVSPDLRSHEQRISEGVLTLYGDLSTEAFLFLSFSHYDFTEKKQHSRPELDYDFGNRVSVYRVGCLFPWRRHARITAGSYHVRQRARSTENTVFSYRRSEILPYVFVDAAYDFGTIEFGYMGSAYGWDYDAPAAENAYDRSGYVDKIKLGYSYAFSEKARIQLSISHVVAIEEFGGGNVQFLLLF